MKPTTNGWTAQLQTWIVNMKKYTVHFEIYGKKMQKTIYAKSKVDAEKRVYCNLQIYRVYESKNNIREFVCEQGYIYSEGDVKTEIVDGITRYYVLDINYEPNYLTIQKHLSEQKQEQSFTDVWNKIKYLFKED